MIRLTEQDTTDEMVVWLNDMADIADPADAANLRECAARLRQLDRDVRDNMQEINQPAA